MKITYLGHAGFYFEASKNIAIDPFITGNPLAKNKVKDVRADLILVSHGHGDHLGDAVPIARQSNGTIVAVNELAIFCANKGANSHCMHIGGSHVLDGIKIKLTPAWHGSGYGGECPLEYVGPPCGFVFHLDGRTIYHSGDTGLFGDMELIGRLNKIDLAMLPIGDNFTMGPEDALEAVKMLKPGLVIPMHYNTWPLIKQDPVKFKSEIESNTSSKVAVLAPGESLEY